MENEKISPMTGFNSPKNWTEDYSHENGNYVNTCMFCKDQFFGHKRRVVCKECTQLCAPLTNEKYKIKLNFSDNPLMSEMIGKEIEVIEASATTWKSIDGYYTFLKSDCEVVPDPTPQQTVKPNPFEILLKHQTKPFDGVRLSDNDKIIHAMTEYAELLSQLRVDEAVRGEREKAKWNGTVNINPAPEK